MISMSTRASLRGRTRPGTPTPALRTVALSTEGSPATDPPSPWLALCPAGATVLQDPDAAETGAIAPGSPVVLVSDQRFGRQRLRRTARQAGIVVEREILLLPSAAHTLVSIDEDADAVRHFWRSVAIVPPGVTWPSPALTAALRLARLVPWRWTGLVAGGHLLIGTRR